MEKAIYHRMFRLKYLAMLALMYEYNSGKFYHRNLKSKVYNALRNYRRRNHSDNRSVMDNNWLKHKNITRKGNANDGGRTPVIRHTN